MIFLCPGNVSGHEIELCPLRSLLWQTFPENAAEDSSEFQVKLCIFIFKKCIYFMKQVLFKRLSFTGSSPAKIQQLLLLLSGLLNRFVYADINGSTWLLHFVGVAHILNIRAIQDEVIK